MSLLNEAKKISNENEKSSREDQMISLLYSFKKNITSQDPFYPLNNLLSKNNSYGWQSCRFCSYPQEIVVDFHSYVNIKLINLLMHEKKIPTIIEFVNCVPKPMGQKNSYSKNNIYYTNKSIGFIKLSSNEETNFKARELRKVHVDIFTKRLKLILHKNYSNSFNLFCQVGIISLNFMGYIVPDETEIENDKLNNSELLLDEDIDDLDEKIIFEKMDQSSKEKLKLLINDLNEKRRMEEYEECKIIKNKIDNLKKLAMKIYNLENYKNQFSAKNDFENSQKFKNEIEKLKKRIDSDDFDINININNSKFNTINTDLPFKNNFNNSNNNSNNDTGKVFYKKLRSNNINKMNRNNYNYNYNNSIKLSQSQLDMLNNSENNYDDVVLPTIQKKINTNLSSINLVDNSGNSYENINSNSNSFGAVESFNDKNEKFNLKDLPPPEDMTEDTKNKFKLIIDLFGEDIFKKIFSKHIQHKVMGFQELNKEVTESIINIKGTTQETNKYIVNLINIFFIFLDDRRPMLVSESLELFINVLKGIKGRSSSNKTEYDFKITKRLLNRIRNKLNHISRTVRAKAEELYSYMLISNFCEYYPLITELVESDVDNFYKKIGMNDRTDLNLGKCINNIMSKGGMSNIKIDSTKELIVTKMNIFMKIFSDIESHKGNKTLNEKIFPKELVGDFIIINVDHPKKEVRFVTKIVLLQYVHIFGKEILYKLRYFVGSKELNKLFQDSPELLEIFSGIEEEEKKYKEIRMTKYKNYLERKIIFDDKIKNLGYDLNNMSLFYKKNVQLSPNYVNNDKYINLQNEIMKNVKEGKSLIKSSSQPEYKVSKKLKLKPINVNNDLKQVINEEQKESTTLHKKKKLKNKKTNIIDEAQIIENIKVN